VLTPVIVLSVSGRGRTDVSTPVSVAPNKSDYLHCLTTLYILCLKLRSTRTPPLQPVCHSLTPSPPSPLPPPQHACVASAACGAAKPAVCWYDTTAVEFLPLGDEEIWAYIESGEPMVRDSAISHGLRALPSNNQLTTVVYRLVYMCVDRP
jgi:hypothetical protein